MTISKEILWGFLKMGTLKPGASYTYENVDGITYSIRDGDLETRTEIGRILKKHDYDWNEILEVSRSNSTLQDAVERVKILYELSKDHGKK